MAGSSSFAWGGQTICGGSSFATCASVDVSLQPDPQAAVTLVRMTVWNLSGANGTFAGTVFTQMGLFNLPRGASYASRSLTAVDGNGQPVSGWQVGPNGLRGTGIRPAVLGVDPARGIHGALGAGDSYTFVFAVANLPSSFDVNSAGFALHGQRGPNGCSTKLVVTDGVANQPLGDTLCQSVVPEPATVILTASGLLGLALVGVARRRRAAAGLPVRS